MKKINPAIIKAARAAGTTPENFARTVREILCAKRCRDTKCRRVFSAQVMAAILSK